MAEYRLATPDRPLDPDTGTGTGTGTARIPQDELGNTYDRVGGPFSNVTP